MPRTTKKTTTRTKKEVKPTSAVIPSGIKLPLSFKSISTENLKNYRPSKKAYIVILILGLILLGYYKKGWFVAAMVNGSPISNFEVLSRINQQYRTQTLNQMVNEKIILDEARKKGVAVQESDINAKIAQIETNVGGAQALDSMLTQQGQTRQSIRQQIRIQVVIEKLYASSATVSADEVKTFIDQNKDQLQSTTSAEQTVEATDILKQQKLSKAFNDQFQQLKQQAKVLNY